MGGEGERNLNKGSVTQALAQKKHQMAYADNQTIALGQYLLGQSGAVAPGSQLLKDLAF